MSVRSTTLHSPPSCATTRSRASSATPHRHAVRPPLGHLPEHDEAARPLAHARRRAARARARRRRADRARLRLRDAARRRRPGRPSACSRTSTSRPDAPAADVQPQVHESYDGGELVAGAFARTTRAPRRAASGTTSSPPTARPCSAPTTRPASRRSWPRSPSSSPIPRSPHARGADRVHRRRGGRPRHRPLRP